MSSKDQLKMQKHISGKEKRSSSNRRHKPQDEEEDEERVRYEIIANNVDNSRTKTEKNNMSKEDGNRPSDLAKAGNVRQADQSETTLERLKRKFLRKNSTKVLEEKEVPTGSSEAPYHQRQDIIASTSTKFPQREHIYDVPFKNSSFEEDSEDDHIYQNGYVWATNNIPKSYSARFRNRSESDKDTGTLHKNSSVACNESTFNGGRHEHEPNKCKAHWQQGKSMSLPASKSSKTKPPSQFPGFNTSSDRKSSCDISSDENNSDGAEPDSPSVLSNDSLFDIRTRSLPMPAKLNFTHHFLTGLNDLCKCGWYWGPLNSKDAEVKLHGKPDGTFLVRDSNDNRYLLSLSFRSEGKTLHTRIEFCKGKFSFYAAPFITSGCHESIVDLIEDCVNKSKEKVFCYSKGRGHNGAAFPVRLTKAFSRFEHVCSLQHLCRFVIRQHFTLENIGEMQLPGMMKKYLWKNHFDVKED